MTSQCMTLRARDRRFSPVYALQTEEFSVRIVQLGRTSHGETFREPTSKVVLSQMPVVSSCLPSDWSITAPACTSVLRSMLLPRSRRFCGLA